LLGEVEELCNRVAIIREGSIVYEGTIAELRETRATQRYRLHTTDDERARVVCLNQSGLRDLIVEGDGALLFSAEEPAVAELSHALVGAGRSEERRVGKGGGAGGGGAGEGDDEG